MSFCKAVKLITDASSVSFQKDSDRRMRVVGATDKQEGMLLCYGERVVNADGATVYCVTQLVPFYVEDVEYHKYKVCVLGLDDANMESETEYDTEREAVDVKAKESAIMFANSLAAGHKYFAANW